MTSTIWRRFGALLATAGLAGSLLATVAVAPVVLAAGCPFGTDNPTECTVSSALTPGPGPWTFNKTLHITGTGSINANVTGITLYIDGSLEAAGGAGGALLLDSNAAVIEANDNSGNLISAGPIKITTTGNVIMQAGSEITATNSFDGGVGGAITIDVNTPGTGVGTKMVLCGPTGSTDPACGGAQSLPGALIDVSNNSGNTASAGSVTINVNKAPVGQFLMGGSGNGFDGAIVRANSSHGLAGSINVTAGDKIVVEPGALVESVAGSGDSSHGGPVSLTAGCDVLVQGTVRSVGPDPGADLVRLEGCEVHVDGGKVYSQAPAHRGASGQCADNGHAADAGVCVEIWARHVIIDNGGQVWADFALSGGITGSGWVDIYAEQDINIVGPDIGLPAQDLTNPPGSTGRYLPPSDYAVHSNGLLGDDTGGVITIKAKGSFITMSGRAVSADDYGNNSNGGSIDVEAAGPVTLDGAVLSANGDFFGNQGGGNCVVPSSGNCGDGGQITVRSWSANLSWKNGVGDARPVNGAAAITLSYCTAVDLTGTTFNNVLNNPLIVPTQLCDATKPTIPAYVVFNPFGNWDKCGQSSISGFKFNDQDNDHFWDPGEPGLKDWRINLYDSNGFVAFAMTAADGSYSFPVTGGQTYKVCEVLQTNWVQTFPTAGAACSGAGEAALGYSVTVNVNGSCCGGAKVEHLDFGNFFKKEVPPECKEDPGRALLLTRTVDTSKPEGGAGLPGSPKNYWHVQAAYDEATGPAEVIGMFSKTTENLVLNGTKSLTITQCESAQVTAKDSGLPVWQITTSGKLLIIGPDSVGGTIGWELVTGGHTLKSIRANGATVAGVRVSSNGNSVSFNNIAGTGIGLDVLGSNNTFKSGTIGPNAGGVHIGAGKTGNTVSGATIQDNSLYGVLVDGSSNTIQSNKLYRNAVANILVAGASNKILSNGVESSLGDGIHVTGASNMIQDNKVSKNAGDGIEIFAGANNTLKSDASAASGENGGAEFKRSVVVINGGSNKADGTSIPAPTKCSTFFTAPASVVTPAVCE